MFNLPFLSILFVALILVCVKDIFKFVYLWQRKEYRFDKMFDFITTKEAFPYFFTIFVFFKLFFLVVFALMADIPETSELFAFKDLMLGIFYISFLGEAIFAGVKLLLKKMAKPVFTQKTILLTALTSLVVVCVPLLYTSLNYPIDIVIAIWVNVFFAPYYIGLIILILTPLDMYIKARVFNHAFVHRKTLTELQVITVSGSYGKTTTKEILAKLLSLQYTTDKTFKNQNTNLSCANKILKLDPKVQKLVCELGSYRIGEGRDICKFALPDMAIITGLNNQHYSLFGSEANIIRAESEAIDFLQPGQAVIINYNSALCRQITVPDDLKLIKYGLEEDGIELDYYAKDIYFNGSYTEFTLVVDGKPVRMKTNAISKGNIQNLVGAICVAHQQGIQLNQMVETLMNIPQVEGTLEVKKMEKGAIIDDSYNANVDGVINALDLLSVMKMKKVVIFDEIIELGKESIPTHEQIASHIYAVRPDLVVLTGKSFAPVVEQTLIKLGFSAAKILLFDGKNSGYIVKKIKDLTLDESEVAVLAEGYRSRLFVKALAEDNSAGENPS